MAEHEPSIGQSDDWYTPREIFEALRLTFDLDPCQPGRSNADVDHEKLLANG
jgi:hypothetical protein